MKQSREAGNRLLEIALDLAGVEGHIGLFPHERFDADAIGASVALARSFEKLGLKTSVIAGEEVPDSLSHLPGLEDLIVFSDAYDCPVFDLALAIDCHEAGRMGLRGDCFLKTPLRGAIDHHVYTEDLGFLDLIDPSASSSCELAFELIWDLEMHLGRPILDQTTAILLLAGVITDTGRYAYSNTTPLVLRQAALLMERFPDLDLAELHYNLYDRTSIPRLQIKGDIFSTITTSADGRIILAHVTQAMLKRRGAPDDELSNLASEIRAADNAAAVFLLIETESGDIRVSIRSNSCFDSAAFALGYGGGGHVKAAGMTLTGMTMEEALARMGKEAGEWLWACSREGGHE